MMEGQQAAPGTLFSRFAGVLTAYEGATEALRARQSKSRDIQNQLIWLENVVSSLISWSVDIRTATDSLTAIEGTLLAEELISALDELAQQCNHPNVDVDAPQEQAETLNSARSRRRVLECLSILQKLVQPIRMAQANKFRTGPYKSMKDTVDDIYTSHSLSIVDRATAPNIVQESLEFFTTTDADDDSNLLERFADVSSESNSTYSGVGREEAHDEFGKPYLSQRDTPSKDSKPEMPVFHHNGKAFELPSAFVEGGVKDANALEQQIPLRMAARMNMPERPSHDVSKIQWRALAREKRAACFGKALKQKVGSNYVWDVAGLIQEKWNGNIYFKIAAACATNSMAIYESDSIHHPCSYHLYLLSSTALPEDAHPTIVVNCRDQEVAQKALSVIMQDKSFNEVRLFDFKYLAVEELLVMITATDSTNSQTQHTADHFGSLCGSRVGICPLPPSPASIWKNTTIGGVITLNNRYYGLTVAHCFHDEASYTESVDNDSVDDAVSRNRGFLLNENNKISSANLNKLREPEPHGAYLRQDGITGGISVVGHLFPTGHTEGPAAHQSRFIDYEHNWALIELQDSRFMQRNEIRTNDHIIRPRFYNFNHTPPKGSAVMAAGASRIKRCSISSTRCGIAFPWSQGIEDAWMIDIPTVPGDCGAWVVSDQGCLYGMAVATSNDSAVTYIIPAETIIESIVSQWSSPNGTLDLFPTNSLSDLKIDALAVTTDDLARLGDDLRTELVPSVDDYTQSELATTSECELTYESLAHKTPNPPSEYDSGYGSMAHSNLSDAVGLQEEATLQGTRTRMSPVAFAFAQIRPDDFRTCALFLESNPNVLREEHSVFFEEAAGAYGAKRIALARACTQRGIILRQCKLLESQQQMQEYVHRLIDLETKAYASFYIEFECTYDEVKINAQKHSLVEKGYVSATYASVLSRPTPSITEVRISSRDAVPANNSQKTEPGIYNRNPPNPAREARFTIPRLEKVIEGKGLKRVREHIEVLDERYKLHPSSFFRTGRVFALLWHENLPVDLESTSNAFRGKFGENIYTTIRRMVVVSEKHGHCICLPIATYGGQGLLKPGFRKEDIEGHAIIHMSDTNPMRLPGEPEISLKPIAVAPAHPDQKLSPQSRLNFKKLYTIEHNIKAMSVGIVTRESLPRLRSYFYSFMNEH